MPKIKDLLQFEKIREVVDIDAINKSDMVEKYVISPAMENHIVHLLDTLREPQHKAAQVIGGYGSGKSHLLAFLISLLTEPSLRSKIQNENIRKRAEALDRHFVVVHWELQPNDVSFIDYFYDQVELQLAEKYAIHIQIQTIGAVDHKKNINEILTQIKKEDPTRGLVVVVDEISDFLKQKTKEKITQDVQFLRVLGQAAQSSDFMFIGAMQEHVFSNPKYVDEADSIGRVAERFQIITINREDIKQVIAQRVLAKTPKQRLQLEELFAEYTQLFPQLQASLDEYINLFPLHPYVIQVFSELPYFEKRGVIQFTIQEVEKILNHDFPCLIAYDRIFDEITARHTIKNLDQVSPIVTAVQTLESKIDLMETRFQPMTRQLIKALAVLRLYGKTTNNGASIDELANTLLALPANRKMEPRDEILMVLTKFRKVTDGQFLNVKDDFYFLDMTITVDYDQVILRKTESLPDGCLDQELLLLLKDQLGLPDSQLLGGFADSCKWISRRSYREGLFIYETQTSEIQALTQDYQIIFVSPFCASSRYASSKRCVVLQAALAPKTVEHLKKTVAARLLMEENYQRSIMKGKYEVLQRDFVPMFVQAYLDSGFVQRGLEKKSIKNLISREFRNFAELFEAVKPDIFDAVFTEMYPEHPKFNQNITRDNSKGEFGNAIKEILTKGAAQSLFTNAKSLLNSLGFLDANGNFSTQGAEAAQYILKQAKENEGKNVSAAEILTHFAAAPYGYDRWMTAFSLILLTYNGEIALKAKGGTTITSSEVAEVFGKNLDAIESVLYFQLESDFNPQPVIDLMQVLGIAPAVASKLRSSGKRGEAVQDFQTRVIELRNLRDTVQTRVKTLATYYSKTVDVEGLKTFLDLVQGIPFADFEKVKTPTDFKKVIYDAATLGRIGEAVAALQQLTKFSELFTKSIEPELEYLLQAAKLIKEHEALFQPTETNKLLQEALEILADAQKLMEPMALQPLLGKLQQTHKQFVKEYYQAHEAQVGSKVDWRRLDDLTQSSLFAGLRLLKHVSILNKHRQTKLENEIMNTGSLRCPGLSVDYLQKKPHCSACQFPETFNGPKIDTRIDSYWVEAEAIHHEWELAILAELENYRNNMAYLRREEKALLMPVIAAGKLPEQFGDDFVMALNNLFRELVPIEVHPEALLTEVFAGVEVLDYVTFEQRLTNWRNKLVAGQDLAKVRLKPSSGSNEVQ